MELALHQVDAIGRRRKRRGRRRFWVRPWIVRRRQFGLYDQLLVEFRNEDQTSFKNLMRMPPICSTSYYPEWVRGSPSRIQPTEKPTIKGSTPLFSSMALVDADYKFICAYVGGIWDQHCPGRVAFCFCLCRLDLCVHDRQQQEQKSSSSASRTSHFSSWLAS